MMLPLPPQTSPQFPRLALVEVWDAEGRLLQAFDVQAWPLRLGAALDNHLVLLDPAAGAHVAEIAPDETGQLHLHAGPDSLALRLPAGQPRLQPGQAAPLAPLARWQVGGHSLRVRTLADPLPPRAAPAPADVHRAVLPALLLAGLAWAFGSQWLRQTPESGWQDYLAPLLGIGGVALLWSLGFGLVSKLFNHRFQWLPHLRLVLAFGLGLAAAHALLGLLGFAFDWPLASRLRRPLLGLGVAALVAQHLALALPGHKRGVALGVATLALLGLGLEMAVQWQSDGQLFSELYSATLGPPGLRLVEAEAPGQLLQQVQELEAPLREAAARAAAKDTGP